MREINSATTDQKCAAAAVNNRQKASFVADAFLCVAFCSATAVVTSSSCVAAERVAHFWDVWQEKWWKVYGIRR
jgi:hypothetical protein